MGKIRVLVRPGYPVLRGKQSGDPDSCFQHQINVPPAVPGEAGVVRDEADPLAPQRRELILGQHVEPRQDFAVAIDGATDSGACQCLVVTGERRSGRVDPKRGRHDGRNLAAQGDHSGPYPRMNAVR